MVEGPAQVVQPASVMILSVNTVSTQGKATRDELLLLFSLRLIFRKVISGRIRREGCPKGGPSLSSS